MSWILRGLAATILIQTLFFKFTGAEESVYIFSTLGLEPWGRIGSGVVELIAAVMLLIPRTVTLGALLSLGVMAGAIVGHLTKLGIVVKDDGGLLFGLALTVFCASIAILVLHRARWPWKVRPSFTLMRDCRQAENVAERPPSLPSCDRPTAPFLFR